MIGIAVLLQVAASSGAGTAASAATDTATVGDTIWVPRVVRVAPRQTVRPVAWEPADPVELAGRPTVAASGATVEIRYPVTVWRPGSHRVEIPGPLVLGADGSADSLPPQVVTLDVRSVLPPAPADSPIAPQPRAAVVPRRDVTLLPLLALWIMALVPLLALRWWWQRRGAPVAALAPPDAAAAPTVPVERWADVGERRAVASVAATRLREATDHRAAELEHAPELARELEELLAALDRTRFGSETDGDVLALVRRAAQLEARLEERAEKHLKGQVEARLDTSPDPRPGGGSV
jgi:hypothetical protein